VILGKGTAWTVDSVRYEGDRLLVVCLCGNQRDVVIIQVYMLTSDYSDTVIWCAACHKRWGMADSDLCPCGEVQTMSHIVESCPLTKLDGGLIRLHSADESAVKWLTSHRTWSIRQQQQQWHEMEDMHEKMENILNTVTKSKDYTLIMGDWKSGMY